MKSRCFAIRRIFTLLVCLLPASTWAFTPIVGEEEGQLNLGWPLNEVGTQYDATSGPILIQGSNGGGGGGVRVGSGGAG